MSERKFYIEVIIFALTAKGLFGVSALRDCIRIQRCSRELKGKNKSPQDLLAESEKKYIIKRLNNYDNIYYLPGREVADLSEKMITFLDLNKEIECEIMAQLYILKDVFDVDVVEPDTSYYLMFKNPKFIRDHKEWERQTAKFVNGASTLRIIAQTGEWIAKNTEKQYFKSFFDKGGKIQLITCQKFRNTPACIQRGKMR